MTERLLPLGFRVASVHCGLKQNPQNPDLVLVVSDRDATSAGVYTRNLIFAAPVAWDRQHTPGTDARAVVLNSGNANACTGERGLHDARQMAAATGAAIGCGTDQVLVLSTGVIGHFLPLDKVEQGIASAAPKLGDDEASLQAAARGMMTTDTRPKIERETLTLSGKTVTLTGLCKGAAMIGPNMGTMLAIVMTDANVRPDIAQAALTQAVDASFNCLSVDGHMSTNDTVLLLANGAAGGAELTPEDRETFQHALHRVCERLARDIADDGEGATHVICLDVEGCRTFDDARRIARSVANSALVKTAIHGADPNWGRIVSAAGYADVPFDPQGVSLDVQGFTLYKTGVPQPFDERTVSQAIRTERETRIRLQFSEGTARVRFWTSDLTAEYVHLNADYRT